VGGIEPFLQRIPEVRELDAVEHPVVAVTDSARPDVWEVEAALPRFGVERDQAIPIAVEALEENILCRLQEGRLVGGYRHLDRYGCCIAQSSLSKVGGRVVAARVENQVSVAAGPPEVQYGDCVVVPEPRCFDIPHDVGTVNLSNTCYPLQ